MGTANRDSSVLTMKRRGMAEKSYYDQWKNATMNTANAMGGVTAPARTSAEVVAEITVGCTACSALTTTDPNAAVPFNPSSGGAGRSF